MCILGLLIYNELCHDIEDILALTHEPERRIILNSSVIVWNFDF